MKYEFHALGVEPPFHNMDRDRSDTTRSSGQLSALDDWNIVLNNEALGDAVRTLDRYRRFREIVLMFAISNIEPLCELL